MSDINPYSTPQFAPADHEPPAEASTAALGELVKSWEKLRLKYNAVLIIPGIIAISFLATRDLRSAGFWVLFGLLSGIGANIAYFLGPLTELYVRATLLKCSPAPRLRRFLFFGGLAPPLLCMAVFITGVLIG